MRVYRSGGIIAALIIPVVLGCAVPASGQTATLKIGGTGAALGGMKLLADAFENRYSVSSFDVLPSLGSGGGIKAVLAGAIDLAVSARPLKDSESAAGAMATAYAKTAIVLATPRTGTVGNLSSAELTAIYAGSRVAWPDGTVIRIVLRPKTETDTILLQRHVAGMTAAWAAARKRPGIPMAYTDQQIAEMIAELPGGIGPVTLSLIRSENRPLRALSLDGVLPTAETIANGSYRLIKTFHLVTGPDPGRLSRKFISFVRSAEGAAILRRSGHFLIRPGGDR